MKHIGCSPTKKSDPQARALKSAANDEQWTVRNPPADVRLLLERAIKKEGRNKAFWIYECLRAGLAKYSCKTDPKPE